MTDDRNDGGVPPPPEPAAPPPLAAAPPTVTPPQPAPQPVPQPYPAQAYLPPAAGSKTGMWVLFIILAFAAGVGGTILVLWMTGDLWNSRSSYSPSSTYSSGSGSFGSTPSTSSSLTPPSTSGGGNAPTEASIVGTWGENCPGSRNGTMTFYSDHMAEGDGQRGSWSLNGNYVTLTNEHETNTLYWEMVNNDTARARRASGGDMRTVNRCP